MAGKRLGIIFIAAVILAFLTGLFASRIIAIDPAAGGDDLFTYINERFDEYYYYDIDDATRSEAFVAQMEAIIEAYAEANDDPYTRLSATPVGIAPADAERFVGIGFNYQQEGNDMRVQSVVHDSPAFGNLYPNDLIVGVEWEGEDVFFADLSTHQDAQDLLRAEEGETRTLLVEDPDLERHRIPIEIREILTPTAYTEDLGSDELGYIRITEFSAYQENVTPGTNTVFADVLLELEQSKLMDDPGNRTLILDLRDNPGGALTVLHDLDEDNLLPGIVQQLLVKDVERPIFEMVDRNDAKRTFDGGLKSAKEYDIVALVNENTASAAEVLAAGLSDYAGYELYGTPTFGKGVYQNTVSLNEIGGVEYALVYTEGEWFYGDRKNVATDPLEVNAIEQSGFYALDLPIYEGYLAFDSVRPGLSAYQSFLNVYYDLAGEDALREDGYFDRDTEAAFERYQRDHELDETGALDRDTAMSIHDVHIEKTNDPAADIQLQALIDLLSETP
ncbi:MAG: S41 family peptidase [Acholeplasmataceae bacterium]